MRGSKFAHRVEREDVVRCKGKQRADSDNKYSTGAVHVKHQAPGLFHQHQQTTRWHLSLAAGVKNDPTPTSEAPTIRPVKRLAQRLDPNPTTSIKQRPSGAEVSRRRGPRQPASCSGVCAGLMIARLQTSVKPVRRWEAKANRRERPHLGNGGLNSHLPSEPRPR